MLRTIAHLLFGGGEEVPEEVKSAEVVEDGWLVVPHQEAVLCENQDVLFIDSHQSNSALHEGAAAQVEKDSSADAEPTVLSARASASPGASGSYFQAKALAEITQSSCVKKTKTWADRNASRNAIQRQNRIRQGIPPSSFHLQQPGQRSLSH